MKKTLTIAALYALPLVAFAQQDLGPLKRLVISIGQIFNLLIPVLIALALVVFFWGLVQYIRTSGAGHTEGKNIMIAGLVALFIMVSVWGIIRLAQNALGVTPQQITNVPQVPLGGSGSFQGSIPNVNFAPGSGQDWYWADSH